jgi:hypothetical protein
VKSQEEAAFLKKSGAKNFFDSGPVAWPLPGSGGAR